MTSTKRPTKRLTTHAKTAYGLLVHIKRIILQEPKRYHQGITLAQARDDFGPGGLREPSCGGTVGCVAGWTVALKAPRYKGRILAHAQYLLGLNDAQARYLFRYALFSATPQSRKHAQAGAAHIQRFIDANRT